MSNQSLSGIRVIDLTNHRGEIAGRLLADLGAEVIKIEPVEGVSSRRLPPFDAAGNSLFWQAYGLGKQCYRLDLYSPAGRDRVLALARGADILLESFDPGVSLSLGIDAATLCALNPGLIYVSITGFGQNGPKAHWPVTSLTLEAAGGRLSLQGDPDRPPVPVGYPQAWLHAGAQAAADALVALNERDGSGYGQHLDLSAFETMWWTLMGAQGAPVCINDNPPGIGDDRGASAPVQGPRTVKALDGLVTIAPGASPPGTRTMYTLAIEAARKDGAPEPELEQYNWDQWTALLQQGVIPPEHMARAREVLDRFVARHTKLELVQWALQNNLRLGPLHTTRDLVSFPQYLQRGFFEDVGGVTQPVKWAQLSATPVRVQTQKDLPELPEWPAAGLQAPAVRSARHGNAFAGLKVADFSWVAAGPTISKALADHGATVVKLESATRPDLSRTLPPHIAAPDETANATPGLNRSYWSFLYATSKLSLLCNLGTPAGRQLARHACDWADVVIESFSPGTMARMGLDYQTLSRDHPDLIMLSTSMLGQTGDLSSYAGYGQQASGFCGLHYITGWPDRNPCGVATPYTDVIAPKFGITALTAALHHRHRTGEGQLIDLAQAECAMMFIAPLILDETVNGRTATARGFDSLYNHPQGVYRCLGTERYIAIAIESTQEWRALCELVPGCEPHWDTPELRRQHNDTIQELIEAWTRTRDAFEIERQLVATGIPASVVQRPTDVFRDPQLEARGLKQVLVHSECGEVIHYGFPTRFSAKDQMVRSAPPCLGEHNNYVMKSLFGLPDREIAALAEGGALE
ncbi:MAG: CoA transferase [Pseudomonadota bacterium]